MAYLIDGHNLIPKIPGLSLAAPDDELELVKLLVEFCRVKRKQVEVFFDNAPPGQSGARKYGAVTAHFVRRGQTADDAIRRRLNGLDRQARNWTVVSSDGEVQGSARVRGAHVISSEAFSRQLQQALRGGAGKAGGGERKPGEKPLGEDELEDWLKLFGGEE